MNQDVLMGTWKQIRGEMKSWWGRLTDDDLDRIEGSIDQLSGLLQKRYGYTRDEAKREIADFIEQVGNKLELKIRQ